MGETSARAAGPGAPAIRAGASAPGGPGRAAAVLWLAALALTVGFVALTMAGGRAQPPGRVAAAVLIDVLGMAPVTVGALVAARLPRNAVGWLLLAGGLAYQAVFFADGYAGAAGGTLPAAAVVLAIAGGLGPVGFGLLLATALVFPTGRLPSPRWQPVVWAIGIGVGAELVASGIAPRGSVDHPTLGNPLAVAGSEALRASAGAVAGVLMTVGTVAALVAVVLRYRRGGPVERTQLKWFTYGVGILIGHAALSDLLTALYPGTFAFFDVSGGLLGAVVLPAAIGIAMLRHGLFDIDRLIRRTAVYGLLWTLITLVYAGVAAGFGLAAAGAQLPVGVAVLLTIGATLVFDPARRRLERLADRIAFGARTDRYALLARFGAQLEATFDLAELAPRLAATVREGLGLPWARVVLAGGSTAVAGHAPEDTPPVTVLPLVHAGATVGRIETGPLSPAEWELLVTLGRQAALAAHNADLAAELVTRLAEIRAQATELAASRARIVAAQDAERRRIERNIHDGAQQQLVAQLAELRRARTALRRDPDQAEDMLHRLQEETRRILGELRELAAGIHPALLRDDGLLAALSDRAARAPIPVAVESDEAVRHVRLRPDVEAAAYFTACEALTNVLKHSRAATAVVEVGLRDGELHLEVRDDGIGLPHGHAPTHLADRVAAAGGTLRVGSAPEGGAMLSARIPANRREPGDA
ncbi:sensor histidine kinase [Pseudonocardia nigra]|uniref:sensor histidine kinase n=1 Tax=Pseudonocardia nigra TaxID=1921578 RepID=UPI001C602537|nr:histidine kinase [Pseudonocardia nigra]